MYSIECNDLLGYTMRKIEPAKNYDVVSFARAMNQDFAPRLKKLFDPEVESALAAQKTGNIFLWAKYVIQNFKTIVPVIYFLKLV